MEQGRFVIITGMSGAGKTQVLRTLEDLNYFCVDNLPVMLLPKFIELSRQTPGRNTAMVIDTRGGDAFSSLVEIMDEMHANGAGIRWRKDITVCRRAYCWNGAPCPM